MNKQKTIEEKFSKLTEEQKKLFIKRDKLGWAILNITLTLLFIFLSIIFIILIFVVNNMEDKYLFLGFAISMIIIGCAVCIPLIIYNKKLTDDKRIIRQLKIIIENDKSIDLCMDNIDNVTILDAYTEVTDKLHAILNYQEIIQTRYYKFKVDYKDGTSKIITEKEGTAKCNNLLGMVNSNSSNESKQQTDSTEELRKYKKLLDDGIITQQEFEQKKKLILGL